ncbi:MAG: site-specific DNA-methyltransferase [Planctomycetaceae bacterium]
MLHRIESQLGPPTRRGDGFLIYEGDCVDLMRRLGGAQIPLTVTSPPYNIGKEYERVRDTSAYLDWCAEWIAEVHRLTTPDGAFWLNLGYFDLPGRARAIPIPYLLWERVSFFLVQEIVWNYGAGVAARNCFSPRNEKFLWYVKDQHRYTFDLDAVRDPDVKYPHQKKNGKLKCNPLGKNPTDVWQFPKVTSGRNRSSRERTPHPAQFPIAVVERIIKACSLPGEIVFDPFVGSGSTIEAALRNGRQAIGFEISPHYVQLAGDRIDAFLRRRQRLVAQSPLF